MTDGLFEYYQGFALAIVEGAIAKIRKPETTPTERERMMMFLESDWAAFLAEGIGVKPGAWPDMVREMSRVTSKMNAASYEMAEVA